MCYYENFRFECGDWKWGNFKRHCQAEYRMGETCGMKLVYTTIPKPGKCAFCDTIDRKTRRLEKAKADYARWYNDPSRTASLEKAWQEMNELSREIQAIQADRQSRMQNVGNSRRAVPQMRTAQA